MHDRTLSGAGKPAVGTTTLIQSAFADDVPAEESSRIRAIPCVRVAPNADAKGSWRPAIQSISVLERIRASVQHAPAVAAHPPHQHEPAQGMATLFGLQQKEIPSAVLPPSRRDESEDKRPALEQAAPEQAAPVVFEARSIRASLFREQAQRAKLAEPIVPQLPAIGLPRWIALALVCGALSCALAFGAFGRVEVTSTALGALTVQEGPRPVISEVAGKLISLGVRRGQHVEAGQPIAQIFATELVARQQKDEAGLALARETVEQRSEFDSALHKQALAALARRRAVLQEQLELKRQMLNRRNLHALDMDTLVKSGVAAGTEAVEARETAAMQREQLLGIQRAIADLDVEVGDREKHREEERRALTEHLQRAEEQLRETQALLQAAEIRAPVTGTVESLLVVDGQIGRAGDVIARVVPDGSLTRAVVFAPAKDAAFLGEGMAAKVEFASLPISEFGRANARVARVSNDVAMPEELAEVLGSASGEPLVRVELELDRDATFERVHGRLRSGERVTARLTTRQRRLITLLFDFLRQWDPA